MSYHGKGIIAQGGSSIFPERWSHSSSGTTTDIVIRWDAALYHKELNIAEPFIAMPEPASTPNTTSSSVDVDFSPDDRFMVVTADSFPYVILYKVENDVFTDISHLISQPASSANGVRFDPSGKYLAILYNTTPFIDIYKIDGETFTKLPDPAEPVGGTGARRLAWTPDSTYLAIAHNGTPYVTIYKRNGDTFTKLPNLTELPDRNALQIAFDPTGTYLSVVGNFSSDRIFMYKRTGDTFTKIEIVSNIPLGIPHRLAWDHTGTYFAVAHIYSPYLGIFKRTGDTFTKLSYNLSPYTNTSDVAWDNSGKYLFAVTLIDGIIHLYERTGDTFTKITTSTLPTLPGRAFRIVFSKDNECAVILQLDGTPMNLFKMNNNVTISPLVKVGNGSILLDVNEKIAVATTGGNTGATIDVEILDGIDNIK